MADLQSGTDWAVKTYSNDDDGYPKISLTTTGDIALAVQVQTLIWELLHN